MLCSMGARQNVAAQFNCVRGKNLEYVLDESTIRLSKKTTE